MNNFIKFYTENNISPVSQDIRNWGTHFNRRDALYRTLGLPAVLFKDRDVIEIAPGSGFNSIVTATYEPACYDLVEPNPAGYEKMIALFDEYKLNNGKNHFYNVMLEDFASDKEYDIALCEGLLPGLSNPKNFLADLVTKVKSGGILVITTSDAVSLFFETMRRYLARVIVSQLIEDNNGAAVKATDSLAALAEVFKSHLATIKGMSRPVEDWIWDVLLNPAAASSTNINEFSIENAFEYFGSTFYMYASSPTVMDNYSWYKDLSDEPSRYNEAYLQSFLSKQLNFLHYLEIVQPDIELSKQISFNCKEFSKTVEKMDTLNPPAFTPASIAQDLEPVRQLGQLLKDSQLVKSSKAIDEFIGLFDKSIDDLPARIAAMEHFSSAFGRGQQYLSLVKK